MEITLDLYREHREALINLNTKLVESLGSDLIMESARMLGLVQRNTVVVDNQEQMNGVMDMAIHESIHGGQTGFQRFAASHEAADETEAAVLNAMRHNTCSLFEIVESYP